jgi:hypothetical protein
MSPQAMLLIKLLTDLAITILTNVKRVQDMTEEEVEAEIKKVQTTRDELMEKIRAH